MNIKSRIKKLENGSNLDSEHCACPREHKIVVIEPDLDRTEEEYQRLTEESEKPEYCDQCRRQIEKTLIVIQEV